MAALPGLVAAERASRMTVEEKAEYECADGWGVSEVEAERERAAELAAKLVGVACNRLAPIFFDGVDANGNLHKHVTQGRFAPPKIHALAQLKEYALGLALQLAHLFFTEKGSRWVSKLNSLLLNTDDQFAAVLSLLSLLSPLSTVSLSLSLSLL